MNRDATGFCPTQDIFFLTAAHRLAKNGAPGVKTGQFRKGSGDIM
jgi:hypothetical protein